jgi:hypothetical protein
MAQQRNRTFRQCITTKPDQTVVYGVDLSTKPPYSSHWALTQPDLHYKCARALPLAESSDVVILFTKPNESYLSWLRGLGMGPGQVVSYHLIAPTQSLADVIIADPAPLQNALRNCSSEIIYVPFFGSKKEEDLVARLGFQLFGCSEAITLKFYDKGSFKQRCRDLGIPTVDGDTGAVKKRFFRGIDTSVLARVVSALLKNHSSLIVRGAVGSGGSSVYKVEHENVEEVLSQIRAEKAPMQFLVEPYLQVIASPNDQWCICADGTIEHLEISAQLFTNLKHTGNIKGPYFSSRVSDYMTLTSEKIVRSMASDGYRGVVGIDYIVTDEAIFPIENNARLNGSTFAIGLVDQFEKRHGTVQTWKFFRAEVDPCTFEELAERLRNLLYDGSAINCVFPFDCDGLEANGHFTAVIVAEDFYHAQYLESALVELGIRRA